MSELVSWMKEIYKKAQCGEFEWKKVYPNNMPCNRVTGIYTDMFLEKDGTYTYLKYTIEYHARCDKDGMSHPDEKTKYFVLHELRVRDLEEKFKIPEPSDDSWSWSGSNIDNLSNLVNNYGRFRYVFDDEETAKSVVGHELIMLIYPYTYILSDEEEKEWKRFIEEQESGKSSK